MCNLYYTELLTELNVVHDITVIIVLHELIINQVMSQTFSDHCMNS